MVLKEVIPLFINKIKYSYLFVILKKDNNNKDVIFFWKTKTIFIHIPKAAGISVYKGLFNRDSFGHRPMKHYQENMFKSVFDDCFKFTFVRNPYDRLHSAYYYLKNGGRGRPYDVVCQNRLGKINDFQDFVLNWLVNEDIYSIEHFTPQCYYLENMRGNIELDYIGKFENLYEDYYNITKILSVNRKLPKINTNQKKKRDHFLDEYTDKMKEIVYKKYEHDFTCLEYE